MGTEFGLILVIVLLLAFIVHQQLFFTKHIHRLVDKLMSRSFTEYQQAQELPRPRMPVAMEVPEDLRPLQEFKLF